MKKIFFILLGIVALLGCNTNSSLSFSEVNQKSTIKYIQSFFQGAQKENGVHLYFDNQNNAIFVYLNESNVIQGEKAVYITDFDVESENDTLNLSYKSNETSDYSNTRLDNELLYMVNLDKVYEVVKLFNNGNEISFGTISGNN